MFNWVKTFLLTAAITTLLVVAGGAMTVACPRHR